MKRMLFLMVTMLAISLTANAQNYKNDGKPYYFYCEMTANNNLASQLRLELQWDNDDDAEDLRDENGKKIEFKSVVDMLNYMSRRGWDLAQTYEYDKHLRFLFRKLVTTDEEAKEGLIFKSDAKKKKD